MNYKESLAFIDSYVNYEKLPDYRWTQAAFRLDRIFRMLELLSNPHKSYPCAHVAGTKGKGSTSAFIASILSSHGKKTGLYVSPHVLDLRERISINGSWINREEFAETLSRLKPVIEQVEKEMIPATYFEILTVAAMDYFSRKKVDVAVFEVGIGGRLDATNVVMPVVSVITSISYDHMDKLGNTIAEITKEKCGIIKSGVPVVSASQKPEALRVIEEIAGKRKCPLEVTGREIRIIGNGEGLGPFDVETPRKKLHIEKLGIEGIHQKENAACAIAAVDHFELSGFMALEDEKVGKGIAEARLKARFELLPGKPKILLDGAHNEVSINALAQTLKQRKELKEIKKVALVGLASDKDIQSCLSCLAEMADEFVFIKTANPRSATAEELYKIFREISNSPAIIKDRISEAFDSAISAAGEDGLVIVTGSFYLAGDVATILNKNQGMELEHY